jgi:hypothetical protein
MIAGIEVVYLLFLVQVMESVQLKSPEQRNSFDILRERLIVAVDDATTAERALTQRTVTLRTDLHCQLVHTHIEGSFQSLLNSSE